MISNVVQIAYYWHFRIEEAQYSYPVFQGSLLLGPLRQEGPWSLLCLQFIAWSDVVSSHS